MGTESTVSPGQQRRQPSLTERIPWRAILSLVILVGFALQVYRLDAQNLWYDEALSLAEATAPLFETINFLRVNSMSHLPLYYVLLHTWLALAGQSEFALRFFSVLFGTASLPLMFQLGRRLFNAEVGLFAAAILAALPVQVYYTQEGRMYTLVTFWGLLSCYLLARLLARGPDDPPPHRRWRLWIGYVSATILMLLSHYFAAFITVFQNAFFALTHLRRRPLLWQWIVAQLCVSIVPGAWLALSPSIFFTATIVAQRGQVSAASPVDFARALWYDLNVGNVSVAGTTVLRPPLGDLAYGLVPLFLIGVIAAYSKWGSAPRDGAFPPPVRGLFATGYLLIPVAPAFFAPIGFQVRYLLIITPAYALLLATSLAWLRRKAPPLAVVGLLCLAVVYAYALSFYYTSYSRSQYGLALRHLAARSRPDDGIVLDGPRQYMLFRHYYGGDLPFYSMPLMDPPEHFPITGSPLRSEDAARDLAALLDRYPRLWVVLAGEDELDPNFFVERWLNSHAFNLGCEVYSNCRVCLYERPLTEANTPVGINFGDRLELAGFGLADAAIPADEPLRLALRWRTLVRPGREYKITLRLVDAESRLWGQADATPTSQYRTTANWFAGDEALNYHILHPYAGIPPGDYRLLIGVYAADTGELLRISPGLGELADLSSIRITRPTSSLANLAMSHTLDIDFGDALRLLGYDSPGGSVRGSQAAHVTLYWQSLRTLDADYQAHLWLVDGQGTIWAESSARPAGDTYPTTEWQAGDVLKAPHTLSVPTTAPSGDYRVRLAVESPDGERLPPTTKDREGVVDVAHVYVHGPRFTAPPIQHPTSASLGDAIRFLGYDLSAETLSPGQTLRLTLYWQAAQPVAESYKVFTHLLDASQQVWGQMDDFPQHSAYLTTQWVVGDVVDDEYEIAVPGDAPPGEYRPEIGMYDPNTGVRLPVFDEAGQRQPGDRILLRPIHIVP